MQKGCEFVIPSDLENRISAAVNFFWETRLQQITKQNDSDTHDQGNRGAVTGGKQLDGFVGLIYDILIMNGVPQSSIFTSTDLELPGFYRPNKKWDLLVVDQNQLVAAIELKSQVGPSFGNNFNNRTEEAMGSALDIWTAYQKGVFGIQNAPWLGYFLVLEDCEKSSVPVAVRSPHFPVLPEFVNASYKDRYEIFCNKLLLERQYSAACLITTACKDSGCTYSCPASGLSYEGFIRSMLGAVFAHFAK